MLMVHRVPQNDDHQTPGIFLPTPHQIHRKHQRFHNQYQIGYQYEHIR